MSNGLKMDDTSAEALMGAIVDQFLEGLGRGQQPEVEEYARRYPQLATVLRQMLPALRVIHLSASDHARASLRLASEIEPEGPLGDFRIVREIGRGGMGVVYEAVQISLGRRVALKILPFAAALDPKQLQRFKNEAQAAAHLQHQHIVPVHYVGCERGVHFYAMQYIEGQTLAAVICELRHLAGLETAIPAPAAEAASSLARELASGRWTPVKRRAGEVAGSGGSEEATDSYRPTTPPHQPMTSPPPDATPPVAALSTERSVKSRAFFRTVAHLGVQAAEALEHAHQLGVIHRDIKPANLLIDATGGLWVADFGLAKLGSEAALTMTGDLVGTLRYMSPEQALAKRGTADARTDVYSLGATLYEMLSLEPAYNGRNREEVLRQIAFEEPRPLSRLNRAVPGELETIVLKAMAKSPEERYATAQELADDLRRYLEDKPIRARRPSLRQRAVKWARRHKTVVRAAVVVLVLAMVALAVSTVLIWRALESERQTSYYQRIALAEREWSANNLSQAQELLDACSVDLRGWEWHYLKRLRLGSLAPLSHASAVQIAVFSPDGERIASGSQDGTVKVWDATTGRELLSFQAHEGIFRGLAFHPDGQRLASAGLDKTARVWDAQTGKELLTLRGHQATVHSVAFSPDGSRLASASQDNAVKLWDALTGQLIFTVEGHENGAWHVAFAPDGQSLASSGRDGTIRIWDARTGRPKARPLRHGKPTVEWVEFSRDGEWLASAACDEVSTADGEVKLWDARTGQEVMTLRGHVNWVLTVAFSPDGRRLATAGLDGNVKLWDRLSGQEAVTLRGHRGAIRSLTFSCDGNRLLSASWDRTVRVWDATPLQGDVGRELLTLRGHGRGVRGVAFHPDGQLLASVGDDGRVNLCALTPGLAGMDGSLKRTLTGSPGLVGGIVFARDGRLLASGGGHGGGPLKVWDATTWKELYADVQLGSPLAFSLDGQYLAAACHQDFALEIRDARTGRGVRALRGHSWAIWSVAFSPSPHLALLASACCDGTVRLWDVTTGAEIKVLRHTNLVRGVAFNRDGRLLASAGWDRTIKVWDTRTWQLYRELPDPTGGVESVTFHPKDSRVLAWGSMDGTVKFWRVGTQEIRTLHGHTSWVVGLAFSPDGERIASASLDGTVKLWQVPPLPMASDQAPEDPVG